jgi:Hint domain
MLISNRKANIMFLNTFSQPAPAANFAAAPLATGLIAGTMVETQRGWTPVENLRLGDRVQTFDGGACPILALDRNLASADSHAVLLPGGLLDTCVDLTLLPGQHILIDTMGDALLPDDALVLIPATALTGWRGTRRITLQKPVEIITLLFAAEEVIFANTGAMVRCPAVTARPNAPLHSDFTRLDLLQAWALLSRLDGDAPDAARMVA